jgi:hypothetical protein
MSIKLTIIAAAALAVLAGPALAGDHDLETELRDSGRYVPQANLPDVKMPGMSLPSGAFASAARPVRGRAPRAFASAARPMRIYSPSAFVTTPAPANDFQLQGR